MAGDRKPRPLSDGMLSILRAMAADKPPHTVWASGRSHQGGLTTAMHALYKRGLITNDHKLTDAGRAAAGVLVVPTTEDQLRSGIAAYLCGAGLDMKLAEDMAPDLLRYARTGAWSGTPGVALPETQQENTK